MLSCFQYNSISYETFGWDKLFSSAMLKRCIHLFGLARDANNGSKRKNSLKGSPYSDTVSTENSASLSLSLKPKDSFVRIVHRGGREELYPCELSALQLMKKYPGTHVATPEIFKNPHESVLWPEQKLFPGQKYFLIPASSVQKLKRKHAANADESSEWDDIVMNPRNVNFEESVFSAKEFFLPKERSPGSLLIKGIRKKKPFVPPLPKARSYRVLGWEPSLTSVQELSPWFLRFDFNVSCLAMCSGVWLNCFGYQCNKVFDISSIYAMIRDSLFLLSWFGIFV